MRPAARARPTSRASCAPTPRRSDLDSKALLEQYRLTMSARARSSCSRSSRPPSPPGARRAARRRPRGLPGVFLGEVGAGDRGAGRRLLSDRQGRAHKTPQRPPPPTARDGGARSATARPAHRPSGASPPRTRERRAAVKANRAPCGCACSRGQPHAHQRPRPAAGRARPPPTLRDDARQPLGGAAPRRPPPITPSASRQLLAHRGPWPGRCRRASSPSAQETRRGPGS